MADHHRSRPHPTGEGVSVVIPHYGDPRLASEVVRVVQRQVTHRQIEVIVSDDASPQPFPDTPGVTVLRSEVNGGFGTAVNRAGRVAGQPWLLILNSDVTADHHFLERLLSLAEASAPALWGPHIDSEPDYPSARIFPRPWQVLARELDCVGGLRERRRVDRAMGFDTHCRQGCVRSTDWVSGAAMLLPTESFRRVGGFDEGFHMYSEEVDLQRRLRGIGVPSMYAGTVSIRHLGGASSDPRLAELAMERADLMYARKWGTYRRTVAAHAAVVAGNFLYHCLRRAVGKPSAPRHRLRKDVQHFRAVLAPSGGRLEDG